MDERETSIFGEGEGEGEEEREGGGCEEGRHYHKN